MEAVLWGLAWFGLAFGGTAAALAGGALALRALLPEHHPGRVRLLSLAHKAPDIAATILNVVLWGLMAAFGVLTVVLS